MPASNTTSNYTLRKAGQPFTANHRIWFERHGQPISPFHDIPLRAHDGEGSLNMVVEIPRWTNAKFEITRGERINPIGQNVKKGQLRFTNNCFPYRGYLWNYGAFPQTWEDPHHVHPDTGLPGDNDPLDVLDIGHAIGTTGEVKRVKVLGIIGLLDGGETDWKVIAIDLRDALADKVNDIDDVEEYFPGLLDATRDFFRIYKIPDGEEPNEFALSGKFMNKRGSETNTPEPQRYALSVIASCQVAWKRLIFGAAGRGDISMYVLGHPNQTVFSGLFMAAFYLPPADITLDEDWHFISRKELDLTTGWVSVDAE
ncbi:inorganic diphosphatase [Apiospora kogelbergensis]|uniref:inorganic diphosphatase n=1 Tax=Apiospora kogelbergensis TaxID=1337665 RepID=UPI00312F62F3